MIGLRTLSSRGLAEQTERAPDRQKVKSGHADERNTSRTADERRQTVGFLHSGCPLFAAIVEGIGRLWLACASG
jgi:hypothetical protein